MCPLKNARIIFSIPIHTNNTLALYTKVKNRKIFNYY